MRCAFANGESERSRAVARPLANTKQLQATINNSEVSDA